ncbi:MAG: DinB family protein [Candidatus Rokubacteria bacterium]|nr:DinB family protein [Candidatus Rokubacteria bacterium]MBI3827140.1 DinB family protein [Candidatus Rokubacteria bacterium]
MGARAEALAKKYEAKVDETTAVIEKLSDADWKTVTTAEKWPVGVVAHHVAGAHQGLGGLVKAIGSGQQLGNMTMDDIHAMNAKHAQEFASVGKAETLALHKKNAAAAAATVRGLSDAELDRSGTVLKGMPAMSAEQLAAGLLVGHMDEHLASIRATVGLKG